MLAALNLFSTPPRKPAGSGVSHSAVSSGLQSLHTDLAPLPPIVKTQIVLPWENANEKRVGREAYVAFTLDNVFSRLECREFIRATESVGYGTALINVGGGRQELMSDLRDSTRCMIDDPLVAHSIFDRIREYLPPTWHDASYPHSRDTTPRTSRLVGLNERLRFLRYTDGQKFAPHFDGTFCRAPTEQHPFPERSYITVQLYLNDGEGAASPEFGGGSTAFLSSRGAATGAAWSGSSDSADVVHCHPRAGRVLVFEHHLLHQGSPVTHGTKYCLRTDAMFQPDAAIDRARAAAADGAAAAAAAAPMSD